jgi:Mn2+/Fe2+ NRAMP family transporter
MTIFTLIAYFIILTTGATLHPAGILHVQTAEQAAQALRPLAGGAAALLFAAGIVGAGLLGCQFSPDRRRWRWPRRPTGPAG